MDRLLPYFIHNLAAQATLSAIIVFAVGAMVFRHPPRLSAIVAEFIIVSVILAGFFTALSWRFRVEYPGNYPLVLHAISSAVPVVFGGFIAAAALAWKARRSRRAA